jgi:hypothetical protein
MAQKWLIKLALLLKVRSSTLISREYERIELSFWPSQGDVSLVLRFPSTSTKKMQKIRDIVQESPFALNANTPSYDRFLDTISFIYYGKIPDGCDQIDINTLKMQCPFAELYTHKVMYQFAI